jgi:hypothetical protein
LRCARAQHAATRAHTSLRTLGNMHAAREAPHGTAQRLSSSIIVAVAAATAAAADIVTTAAAAAADIVTSAAAAATVAAAARRSAGERRCDVKPETGLVGRKAAAPRGAPQSHFVVHVSAGAGGCQNLDLE